MVEANAAKMTVATNLPWVGPISARDTAVERGARYPGATSPRSHLPGFVLSMEVERNASIWDAKRLPEGGLCIVLR